MKGRTAERKMRWWVPAVIVAILGSLLVWLFVTENVARYIGSVVLPVFGLLLVGLWSIFLTGLPWRRRLAYFGVFATLVVGAGMGLAKLTRWEGSLSGGAIPNLVWKWSEKADAKLAVPPMPKTPIPVLSGDAEPDASSFPQFLGPDRSGVLPNVALDPDWNANAPQEVWRTAIGAGWSGFAVASGRAVTQEQRGEKELVTCYGLAGGRLMWAHEDTARFSEAMGGDGPRATPTIREGRVYVMGATGVLNCLELDTGSAVWSRDILEDSGASIGMYGKACSPLVVDDLVIVTGGDKGGPTLLAFDKVGGALVWKSGTDAASYASPVVATLAGRRQILSSNANTVTGHAIATGKELWKYDWPSPRYPKSSQAQPIGGDRVLLTASYGLEGALIEISAAADGGEAFAVSEVWRNNRMKTKFSNVCVAGGYAYGLDEGRLACIDLETGERMWKGGSYGYGQNLMVGRHLVVQAERGFVALVDADPEKFVEVARIDALDGKTWNNPALAGDLLLLRNDREAVCFRVVLREGGMEAASPP